MYHPAPSIVAAVAPRPTLYNNLIESLNKRIAKAYLLPSIRRTMCSPEQRINLYLLADQTIAFGVPGDFVELGCYEGQTASVIASVLQHHGSERRLHLYDDFQCDFSGRGGVRERLMRNLRDFGPHKPVVHDGRFEDTLPNALPERIAFVHIDCGVGDLPENHRQIVRRCLETVYPRMSPGAIGVLMDYHDPERTVRGWDSNPGVKEACDRFFQHKPECIQILYGNRYSHAFFRKVW